ncbi:MAG: OmpA family protein [Bacteroidia bacterium]|nr:OmpA family protein [Bacteroidia bacterium]
MRIWWIGLCGCLAAGCVSQDRYDQLEQQNRALLREAQLERRLNEELQSYVEALYYTRVEPGGSVQELPSVNAAEALKNYYGGLNPGDSLRPGPVMLARDSVDAVLGRYFVRFQGSMPGYSLKAPVRFPAGSAAVPESSRELLFAVAQILRYRSGLFLIAEGHVDSREAAQAAGTDDGWSLSAQRASAVVRMLIQYGAPPERLAATGRSSFHMQASNQTEDGRSQNRRVEIVLSPVKP